VVKPSASHDPVDQTNQQQNKQKTAPEAHRNDVKWIQPAHISLKFAIFTNA
jgi:hypothetical protein